jgi:hypothetical protein
MIDEMREVRETVEGLIAVLEHKAAEIEDRLHAHFDRLALLEREQPVSQIPMSSQLGREELEHPAGSDEGEPGVLTRAFELLSQGNDSPTVAQMTGLTVAEIETAARMKELRSGRK